MKMNKNIDYLLAIVTSIILTYIIMSEDKDYKISLIIVLFIFLNIMILRYYKNSKLIDVMLNEREYKNDFLANLSHEIRTSLNGIIGFSEILNESKLNKDQKESVNIILKDSNNLLNLIINSIDRDSLSRFDSNRNIKFNYKPKDIKDINILIVDDVHSTRKILKNILKNNNIPSECVSSGEDALEIIKKIKFDMIFMDINLEKINGIETTQKIRSYESFNKLNHLPIIAITALTKEKDKEDILRGGLDYYLSKPISIIDIKLVLNKFMYIKEEI